MAIDFGPFYKWFWVPAMGLFYGSIDWRIRNKVDKDTFETAQKGVLREIDGVKKHVDDKFKDWKQFQNDKFNMVLKEIKKANGGS